MKIADVKHNHSLTDLLKILLFTILMLAPVGMVTTKCLYVIVNKNAYQSYSGNINTEYVNITDIELGAVYNLNVNNIPYESYDSGKIIYTNPNNIETSNLTLKQAILDNTYIRIYATNTNKLIELGIENTSNTSMSVVSIPLDFEYELVSYQSNKETEFKQVNKIVENTNNYYLDNVFEYSISQLEESTLFNWTENTAIFSGINAMNTQLGINSPAIGIILTYWLILTCIYVIIDIVLKLFTILTHAIGRKT